MRRLVLLLLVAALFSGCAKFKAWARDVLDPPRCGHVAEKWNEPAHDWTYFMPIICSDGKTTTTIYVPIPMYDPPAWAVRLENGTRHGTWYIARETWDQLAPGDSVTFEPEHCGRERAHERREYR